MDSIYILVPIAIVFTVIAVAAFFWAVNNRQYDDLDASAHSILFDDDAGHSEKKPSSSTVNTTKAADE
ncbi:cbb3-type cytochrome oxidase assembly protein CcoS [Oceanicoccus sagamiensis]|uniref:Cytochrome oxidase maturation protein, cbb3-type n=1 Tax=Oceanicoccus sagamiensis TaxID=716816 RepID=A0A1X9N9L5_9GAMM|nr:cbb3-type cytochrome oxidase assembly protein CcoS [Oceanicoccus sagamiensis]ARN74750.1 cytochrome oxidase maturation protein, cbb3-type [Oceanicoccus sagamiensis]